MIRGRARNDCEEEEEEEETARGREKTDNGRSIAQGLREQELLSGGGG